MRIERPSSIASITPASIPAAPSEGDCVVASTHERGDARDDGAIAATYRPHFREAAYYSTGRDWEDYAPAYRCGIEAFSARTTSSLRFSDVESALANAWTATRGDSRLGWAEARGAVLDAWLRQCDARTVGVDRRRSPRRSPPAVAVAAPPVPVAAGPEQGANDAARVRSPPLDVSPVSVDQRSQGQPLQASNMSTLKKDHVAGTGGSAVAGGATGAAIGAALGGPIGLAVGAVAGTAVGALAGHKASNAIAPDSELGHFEDSFKSMPYYVSEMKWSDYAPAYRYGLETYRSHGAQGLGVADSALEAGWPNAKGGSRLLWSEARSAVAHAWRAQDESMRNDPD